MVARFTFKYRFKLSALRLYSFFFLENTHGKRLKEDFSGVESRKVMNRMIEHYKGVCKLIG